MQVYLFTPYFENEVLRKRPYLKKEWCIRIIENPLKSEPQDSNRFRFWGRVAELDNRAGPSNSDSPISDSLAP